MSMRPSGRWIEHRACLSCRFWSLEGGRLRGCAANRGDTGHLQRGTCRAPTSNGETTSIMWCEQYQLRRGWQSEQQPKQGA